MYKWQSDFMKYLKSYKNQLTNQQYKTLKGQMLSGDMVACRKGLTTILNNKGLKFSLGRW